TKAINSMIRQAIPESMFSEISKLRKEINKDGFLALLSAIMNKKE
ncbi:781_t:CDS:2, partial [Gigaspora rosea]